MPARVLQEFTSPSIGIPADDSSIQTFIDTEFDAVSFLNQFLPSLSFQSAPIADQARVKKSNLQEVSSQTQALVARVNAQNIRFASSLSQSTDEILRSGSRLAYEVEVLRGDANALHESLTDTLGEDIRKFTLGDKAVGGTDVSEGKEQSGGHKDASDPDFINQLRTLGQVKARLEEVINVFGEAMKWPMPPSELSLTSSLISVSAPESGSEQHSQEEKGKQFAKEFRAEVIGLLTDGSSGPDVEAAATKIEELRLLSTVWKGTAEERARNKLVDSLSKVVEETRRQIEARSSLQHLPSTAAPAPPSISTPARLSTGTVREGTANETGVGGGLFRNLQRLRDEIYLD